MASKKQVITLTLIIVFVLSISACSQTEERLTGSNFKFDTMVSLSLITNQDGDLLIKAYDEMDRIESLLSAHDESSIVSTFNSMDKGSLDIPEEVAKIIQKSIYYSKISNGQFDITVYPLVQLWGIGTEDAKVPSDEDLHEVLSLVGYEQLKLDGLSLSKNSGQLQIDLGGIAKGYATDQLVEFLKVEGISNGYIDLGGNLYMMGTKEDGQPWVAGIQDPVDDRGNYIVSLEVEDKSIVTSGPYERYFEEDGVRYHHILDPSTGYPVENGLSGVSIISDYSIDGDALSTAVFALGLDDGLKLLNSLEGIDGLLITKEKVIYMTDDFDYNLKLTDDSYKLFQ